MNLSFYRSRVSQHFHRLPTLGLPLTVVMCWLAMTLAMVLAKVALDVSLDEPRRMMCIPLFLGLGAIGRDASDGLLPVFLTRPLPRSSYVLSHWAALGTVASFWCLLHLLGQWAILQFADHGARSLAPSEVLFNAWGRTAMCFGIAAPLVCFSTRLPSFGNLVLWGVLYFVAEHVLPGFGSSSESLRGFVFTARQLLSGLLIPELDFRRTFIAEPISWHRLTTYLSDISLLLLLAVHLFNRREVSYASR